MVKDLVAIFGLDTIGGFVLAAIDPTFLKIVLVVGFLALVGLFYFTRHGRVSIYGTQMVMALALAIRYN